MAGFTTTLKNPTYRQSSFSMLLFFASWGIWWSFFQIWLTSESAGLALNGAQVGTVYSVNSLATLVLMFAYGAIQDRLGIRKHLAVILASVTALVGPFCTWVYQPLLQSHFMTGVILGAIVLSIGFLAGVGLFEALTERFSRRFNFEYGQARMWGSFGYAVVALAAGFLFTINPALNFWIGSALGLIHLLLLVFSRTGEPPVIKKTAVEGILSPASTPTIRDMLRLFRLPSLWLIILFVMLSWTFYTVFDQQMFPDFYTGLFETPEIGQRVYGILNSVQVFLEAAMLGIVPLVMRRVGVRTSLLLGVSIMFIRILGCALVDDPIWVSAIKMLHAIETPLFILPVFRYFTLHFNPALSATLYMVGFQVSAQIGNVILSTPLGALHDRMGYQQTFITISVVVLFAGVYGFFALKKDDQQVDGDPFMRHSKAAVDA
ncbi:galactoside permease [Glutamicibacter halophytocola]|uniref:MFS transporter n=1 Tax=Glutamicibacter halophytocola TaxID=1933880 RepID=UPI0006D49FED|nr:MFS transporter [Glutamicibacter halophytocola]ALG29597.1 galactoside permease [Glutamicibacter halophytocola]